jgi:biotin/methionine sulfoxide reductase
VLVQIERYDEDLPPITAFDPPEYVQEDDVRRRPG